MKVNKRVTALIFGLCLAGLSTHASAQNCGTSDCSVAPAGDCGCQSQGCQAQSADCGCQTLNDCGSCGSFFNGQNLGRLQNWLPRIGRQSGCGCQNYVSIFGGATYLEDYDGVIAPPPANPVSGTFNDGFVLGLARGRYINKNTRFETEWNWRNNTGDVWTDPAGTPSQFDGQLNNYAMMFNLVRDIQCAYVGGGIGVSRQDGDFDVTGTNFELEDWAFAYQAIAGVNLIKRDNFDVFAEYRYFGNTETELLANDVFFDNFVYDSHNVVFGFRFRR